MTTKYFTGIGSRDITEEEYSLLLRISKWVCSQGYTLRSGHALGSDSAFEEGASHHSGQDNREIYIPYKNFKGNNVLSDLIDVSTWSEESTYLCECIARMARGGFWGLSIGGKNLHSRNVPQVLGKDLKTPSDFVLFCSDETKGGNVKGGTATAVKIAKAWGIPTFNIRGKSSKEVYDFLLEQGLTA